MAEIKLEIENCQQCPHFHSFRMYTSDSWEMAFDWFCKKADMKKIAGYVEREKIAIPDWCPEVKIEIKTKKSKFEKGNFGFKVLTENNYIIIDRYFVCKTEVQYNLDTVVKIANLMADELNRQETEILKVKKNKSFADLKVIFVVYNKETEEVLFSDELFLGQFIRSIVFRVNLKAVVKDIVKLLIEKQ